MCMQYYSMCNCIVTAFIQSSEQYLELAGLFAVKENLFTKVYCSNNIDVLIHVVMCLHIFAEQMDFKLEAFTCSFAIF